MGIVSHKDAGYKELPIYKVLMQFFNRYLIDKDLEKIYLSIGDGLFSFGTVREDFTVGKEAFFNLLKHERAILPDEIDYKIDDFFAIEIATDVWEVAAKLSVLIHKEEHDNIEHITRFTGCCKVNGTEGTLVACNISKGNYDTEANEFMPFKFHYENNLIDKHKSEQAVLDIIWKTMPGGIIAGYVTEGFPVCFVNDKFLEMLGYSSYEEYSNEIQQLAIHSIHPDDRAKVTEAIYTSYDANEEYGIEYRIRHKNGEYIHVYDIGKKITTLDNREIIICVLIDVTETVKLRNILSKESSSDELTGIYNRRGGIRVIEKYLNEGYPYTFAIFDIDNLKLLNDEYNHKVGDCALRKFAELMKESFGKEATLSRFGGDEFIFFAPQQLSMQHMENIFKVLQNAYNGFIQDNYPKSNSSVSIGCVIGTQPSTFDSLYQAADELMYSIKKNGKNGCKVVGTL